MNIVDSHRAIGDVVIGKRVRSDLGDIQALAESIQARGLLHPIAIAPTGDLLAGHRRLEAVKLLGWESVPVRIVTDVATMADLVAIERDENTQRKDFTPSEADAMRRVIEGLEKPKARQRQARPGQPRGERSAKLAEQARPRDVAAEATGLSHETLRKAGAVVDAAKDESLPADLREVAQQAQAEMDATGKVDPAFKKVQAITDADPAIREKSVGVAVAKMFKGITVVVADVTPAAAAGLVDPEWRAERDNNAAMAIQWLTAYREALSTPLRAVGGRR